MYVGCCLLLMLPLSVSVLFVGVCCCVMFVVCGVLSILCCLLFVV